MVIDHAVYGTSIDHAVYGRSIDHGVYIRVYKATFTFVLGITK